MTKLLSSFLFCMILVGCGGGPKPVVELEPSPAAFQIHAVHNVCADLWAVKTWQKLPINQQVSPGAQDQHRDHYWGKASFSGNYEGYTLPPDRDSADDADLGSEYQFKDSATAMRIYHDFIYRRDRPRQIADSIFKYKHTYQP